jgi:hypothetical protein
MAWQAKDTKKYEAIVWFELREISVISVVKKR